MLTAKHRRERERERHTHTHTDRQRWEATDEQTDSITIDRRGGQKRTNIEIAHIKSVSKVLGQIPKPAAPTLQENLSQDL